jgi:hypothetical protein
MDKPKSEPKFKVEVVGLDIAKNFVERGLIPRMDLGRSRQEDAPVMARCLNCTWYSCGGDWVRRALDHIRDHERCVPTTPPGEASKRYIQEVELGRQRRKLKKEQAIKSPAEGVTND